MLARGVVVFERGGFGAALLEKVRVPGGLWSALGTRAVGILRVCGWSIIARRTLDAASGPSCARRRARPTKE